MGFDAGSFYSPGQSTSWGTAQGTPGVDNNPLAYLQSRMLLGGGSLRGMPAPGYQAEREDVYNAPLRRPGVSFRPEASGESPADTAYKALRNQKMQSEMDAEAQQQAMAMAPPPMRTVTGPNVIPGQVMDVNKMNAIQRKLYLPQGSNLNPGDLFGGGAQAASRPQDTGNPNAIRPNMNLDESNKYAWDNFFKQNYYANDRSKIPTQNENPAIRASYSNSDF